MTNSWDTGPRPPDWEAYTPPYNAPTVEAWPQPQPTPASPPPPAVRPWWRRHLTVIIPWVLVAGLAVALLVVLLPAADPSQSSNNAGAAPSTQQAAKSTGPAVHDFVINFELRDRDSAHSGCVGAGGYNDIGPGTPVTVKSATGEILGASSLGSGTSTGSSCTWTVQIPGVRLGESFYSAEVGDRGAITKSGDELKADGYAFDLSLGS